MSSLSSNPQALLIEPAALGRSERADQMKRSGYSVTQADNLINVFLMREALEFSLAVLDDRLGLLALRASARLVRAQWPKARILLLGDAPRHFEDFLYDEAVVKTADEDMLCAAIQRLIVYPPDQRSAAMTTMLQPSRAVHRLAAHVRLEESDPTKALRLDYEDRGLRNWSAPLGRVERAR